MKYAAFISYSHAADGELAPALETGIRRFAAPWYRVRRQRVFRDQTGLSMTPALWPSIQTAMDDSRFFILLASTEAARSKWVRDEVQHWLARPERKPRLMIVRTDGFLVWDTAAGDFDWARTTALPPELRGAFEHEPRWVDLGWARTAEHVDLRDGRFADAVADITATLLGKEKDEIAGEDVRQHRRALRHAWTAAALLVILASGAGVAAFVARQQLAAARRNLAASLAAQAETAEQRNQLDAALNLTAQAHAQDPDEVPLERLLLAHAKALKLLWETPVPFAGNSGSFRLARERGAVLGLIDGSLTLWDLLDGRKITHLPQDGHAASAFSITPDAHFAVAVLDDDTVRLFDLSRETPSVVRTWPAEGSPRSIDVRRDGAFAAAIADDRLLVWDTRAPAPVISRSLEGWQQAALAFSPDGWVVAADARGSSLRLNPAAPGAGEQRRDGSLRVDEDGVFALSDDGRVATSQFLRGRGLIVWEVASGRMIQRVHLPRQARVAPIVSMAFSPDARVIAYALSDGWLGHIDLEGANARTQLVRPGGDVTGIGVLDGGRLALLSLFGDHLSFPERHAALRLVSLDTGRPAAVLSGHSSRVTTAAFDPSGRTVASGGDDGVVRLWNAADGTPGLALYGHEEAVTHVRFTPDGTRLVTAGRDATVRVWDPATGTETESWEAPFVPNMNEYPVLAVGSGSLVAYKVAASPWESELRLRRLGDPSSDVALPGQETFIIDAAFDRTSSRLAAATVGGFAYVWDVTTPAAPRAAAVGWWRGGEEDERSTNKATSVDFPLDENQLLVGYESGSVALVDLTREGEGRELGSHAGPVARVVAAARGPVAVSVGGDTSRTDPKDADHIVHIWDLPTATEIAKLPGHPGGVLDAALSADGRRLATVGRDFRLRLWDMAGPLGRLRVRWRAEPGERVDRADPAGFGVVSRRGGRDAIDVMLVDLHTGRDRARLGLREPAKRDTVHVDFSPDGARLLVTASRRGKWRVDLWDTTRGRRIGRLSGFRRSEPDVVGFALDSRQGFIAFDGSARTFDAGDGSPMSILELPFDKVQTLLLGPNSRFVVAVAATGETALVDAAGRMTRLAAADADRVVGVDATVDGDVLVDDGENLRVVSRESVGPRDVADPYRAAEVADIFKRMRACNLTGDARFIPCAGSEGRLRVLDARSGATVVNFKAYDGDGSPVWWITVPKAGGQIVSVNVAANTVETWDFDRTLRAYDTLRPMDAAARLAWVRARLEQPSSRFVRWAVADDAVPPTLRASAGRR